MGNLGDLMPPSDDAGPRRQRDLERRVQEEAAARRAGRTQIGDGGTFKVDGTLEVSGELIVPAGSLSSPGGDVSAGVDVSAGRDVEAARDVTAGRDVAAVAQVRGANGLFPSGLNSLDVHSRIVTGSGAYTSTYTNAAGQMGQVPSSARFKRDVEPATVDVAAVLAVQLVTFRYINAVENLGDEAAIEWGVIAEEIDALGLTWLVVYDDEGRPLGVHYERLAVALLGVVQDHERRLVELEAAGS
jgi:hypothetical protein